MAIKRRMLVKIFMIYIFESKNTKNCLYAKRPLTLVANNLTAIAKSYVFRFYLCKTYFIKHVSTWQNHRF